MQSYDVAVQNYLHFSFPLSTVWCSYKWTRCELQFWAKRMNKRVIPLENFLKKNCNKIRIFHNLMGPLPRASSRLRKGYLLTNCIILVGFRQSLKDKVFNNVFVQFLNDFDVELWPFVDSVDQRPFVQNELTATEQSAQFDCCLKWITIKLLLEHEHLINQQKIINITF